MASTAAIVVVGAKGVVIDAVADGTRRSSEGLRFCGCSCSCSCCLSQGRDSFYTLANPMAALSATPSARRWLFSC